MNKGMCNLPQNQDKLIRILTKSMMTIELKTEIMRNRTIPTNISPDKKKFQIQDIGLVKFLPLEVHRVKTKSVDELLKVNS